MEVEPVAGEIRIGRRAGSELELPFPAVSGQHARLARQSGGWVLVDLASVNGTWIRGRRLAPHTAHPVSVGEVLKVADVTLTFEAELGPRQEPPPDGTEGMATIARRLVNDLFVALGGGEVPRLLVASGPSEGEALRLVVANRPYRLGRSRQCDLVLPDEDASREHAALERRSGGVFIVDLGSKNGVEVGGERVSGERRLHDGDELVVGSTRFRFEDPEERYLRRMQSEALAEPAPSVEVADLETFAAHPQEPREIAAVESGAERALADRVIPAVDSGAGKAVAAPAVDGPAEQSPQAPRSWAATLGIAGAVFVLLGAVGLAIWLLFGGT